MALPLTAMLHLDASATAMGLLGALPVLAALGQLRIWHLYAVVTPAGIAALFASVAAQSFTPQLVPRERLLAANSTLMLSNATVNTTGSAVGGLLVSALTASSARSSWPPPSARSPVRPRPSCSSSTSYVTSACRPA
ncbi:hypothetical protein ACWEPN_21015 [Nonomuraea wenchangensis]